jgi:hypothetical protein
MRMGQRAEKPAAMAVHVPINSNSEEFRRAVCASGSSDLGKARPYRLDLLCCGIRPARRLPEK